MSTVSSPTEFFHSDLTTSPTNNNAPVVPDRLINKVLSASSPLTSPKKASKISLKTQLKSKKTTRARVQASKITANAPGLNKSLTVSWAVPNTKSAKLQKSIPQPEKQQWNSQLVETLTPPTPTKIINREPVDPALHTSPSLVPTETPKVKKNLFSEGEAKVKVENEVGPTYSVSKFKKLDSSLKNGNFSYNAVDYKVCEIAQGSYCAVYELSGSTEALLNQHPISELVIKAYHGKKTGFYTEDLNTYLEHSIQNYISVISLGLPVAVLINADTASTDGCFIQKKIPHKLNILDAEHIRQAKDFFTSSVLHNVLMDLQPANLRATSNNQIVLIDFVEEEDDLSIFISKACSAWIDLSKENRFSKQQARELLIQLTSGFLNSRSEFTLKWLNALLNK